jgi:hypothetical protein
MPVTYENITTTTLSSAAASITLSSIPQSYTDLKLTITGFSNTGASNVGGYILFNNDTAANYAFTVFRANGSAVSTLNFASNTQMNLTFGSSGTNTTPYFSTVDIFSYTNALNKPCLIATSADLNSPGNTESFLGRWANSAAINRIDIYTNAAADFGIGTIVTLYGIKNA